MGYLLQDSVLIKKIIRIPEADVQNMDASNNPFPLVSTNNSFYCIPVICLIQVDTNQTTPYIGFNHLHLSNTGNTGVGDQVATFSKDATTTGSLEGSAIHSMLINLQATPNRFGGINAIKDLVIYFDTPVSAGNGDLIVTLYYIQISI